MCRKCPTKVEESQSTKEYRGKFYLQANENVYKIKFFGNQVEMKRPDLSEGDDVGTMIEEEFKGKVVSVDVEGELEEGQELKAVRISAEG